MQHLRKAEKANVKEEYEARIGEIVNGIVRRFENGNIVVDLGKAEGILSARDKIPGEQYMIGDRINALLIRVDTSGSGPSLVLSRASDKFVVRLFEREVSEIHDGIVTIKATAREPGSRTKLAVDSTDGRVDPIGACVGLRGMRVKNITTELNGERIDIIRYDSDIRTFATNALQPAKPKAIAVDEKKKALTVYVTSDQARLAFGKRAQNVRLSSKLVGWNMSIIEDTEKEESFEEKKEKAIAALAEKVGIDTGLAEKLVNSGFLSIEGLRAAGPDDFQKIEGVSEAELETLMRAIADNSESQSE
jgi:N utilization substance protein A